MPSQYGTARAFRQALETRLMKQSKMTGVDLGRLRRQVAFERLLYLVRLLQVMTPDDLHIARGQARSSAAVAAIASGAPGAGIHISFRKSPA